MDAWAFLLGAFAGVVAAHVASAVVIVLILLDEERSHVRKNDARIVEYDDASAPTRLLGTDEPGERRTRC